MPLNHNFFLKKFHDPDFNIIIDLPAQEGYTRKNDGTSLAYLQTREKYYQAITGTNTIHLDGHKSIEELAGKITKWITSKLEVVKI